MTDSTQFEDRLTVALGRYADQAAVDVDPLLLVRGLATGATTPRTRPRVAVDRLRLSLAVIVLIGLALLGVALFGSRIVVPLPPVVVSPSPSTSAATTTASPATSSTPLPTASSAPTTAAVPQWTARDIGAQPAVTNIWRVGEWFLAVGPESSFADDDRHVAARFIRSRDGQRWVSVPAPARDMEVETGTVVDGTLWLVGRAGTAADPKRGIWTTLDGVRWQRVADVTGLDFGPGRVDAISHASAGWFALASRWIDAESQEALAFRSKDGVAWTKVPYPNADDAYGPVGLTSDGDRWLFIQGRQPTTGTEVWALTSTDGTDWTETLVAQMSRGSGSPDTVGASAATFGSGGFVIVGQVIDGEVPSPIAWVSADGVTWTEATMKALPVPAGDTGLRSVVAFEGGYLAAGYRLEEFPSFWTSVDGSSWAQVDDPSNTPPGYVQALAASDETFVAGGQTSDGGAFIWTATH